MTPTIFVAKSGGLAVLPGGDIRRFRKGDTVLDGDPLLRGREHLFKPFQVTHNVPIQAEAAPTRRRLPRRRAAAAKPAAEKTTAKKTTTKSTATKKSSGRRKAS